MAEPARNLEPEQPRDNVEYLPGASPLSGDELGGEADPNGNVIDASNLIRERDGMSDQVDQSGQPQPTIGDRVQDAQNQYEQGREKASRLKDWYQELKDKRAAKKALRSGAKEAGKKGLQGVEQETVKKAAGKKLATHAAGEAVEKKAVKTVRKKIASAGVKQLLGSVVPVVGNLTMLALDAALPLIKKYWKVPVLILAGLIVFPSILFALLAGKGLGEFPTTPGHQNQVLAAAYLGGDFLAGRQLTDKVVQAEKNRYQTVITRVKNSLPSRSDEVQLKITEITTLMDQAVTLSGDPKKKLVSEIVSKVKSLDDSLPYGQWIADIAKSRVGDPNVNFCTRTKAAASVACGSFVTETLQAAGVPIPLQASTLNVWRLTALKLVANRQPDATPGYFDQIKNSLQPGDIIWWGDGNCSSVSYSGKIFDHVGFYIGNGESVDTSSATSTVRKRGVHDRPTCWSVNGAKRYGAKL